MTETLTTFYLADWYIDTGTNRVCRGGSEIKLESKVTAVLGYLAQHQGELVTREELERAIWGNAVVSYDALTRCIAKLRKVLEDDPRHPQYIETISKKGYRLIGKVSVTVDSPHTQAEAMESLYARRRLLWLRGAIAAVLLAFIVTFVLVEHSEQEVVLHSIGDRPSIVVLPFTNNSEQTGHDYFSEGITADITTELAKLSALSVISPLSASGYRDMSLDIKQAAGALGVRYVVEGVVQRNAGRLRINVHLVDAERDIYLWSEKYDRKIQNLFAVQDDIAANIVNALAVNVTEQEKRRTASRYTTSIAAYDDFLRAQSLYGHYTDKDNQLARNYYQQAIDRDESFARAYSGVALTYVAERRYGWVPTSPKPLDRALKLAKLAVSLDSESPQSNWVLGYVHLFRKEYQEAASMADKAITLDPNFSNSYVTLAVCKMHLGEAEEALHLVRKAMLLNPIYPASYISMLGQIYFVLNEYEQALPVLRKAIDRNVHLPTPQVFLIVTLSKLGQDEEAAWAAEQLKTIAPDFNSNNLTGMLPLQNAEIIKDMQRYLKRFNL